MKFSENGFYVEKYIKCNNCGELLYNHIENNNNSISIKRIKYQTSARAQNNQEC